MDPYVIVEFGDGITKESMIQKNAGLQAKWNQKFMIDLEPGWAQTVSFIVKDKCKCRADPIIG